jgi:predicted ATPase
MFAHFALAFSCFQIGQLLVAKEHFELAIALYDRKCHRPLALQMIGTDTEVQCLGHLAYTLWALGYADQALARANEALDLARAISQPFSIAFAEQDAGFIRLYRGEAGVAQEHAQTILALCAEHGIAELSYYATILSGAALVEEERFDEAIFQIQTGLAKMHVTGASLARPSCLTLLAEACSKARRFEDGLIALAEAEVVAEASDDRQFDPDRYRIKGELLLNQNDSQGIEAENCFRRAIENARYQSAKSLELRATTSLARLLRDTNRRDEARTTLAEIYNWFTEGFDTADLKDAKALLDELSNSPN